MNYLRIEKIKCPKCRKFKSVDLDESAGTTVYCEYCLIVLVDLHNTLPLDELRKARKNKGRLTPEEHRKIGDWIKKGETLLDLIGSGLSTGSTSRRLEKTLKALSMEMQHQATHDGLSVSEVDSIYYPDPAPE